jgi:hypothetical protein
MTSNGERKISSLRDLPLDIAPPRDLWQQIEARIAAEPRAGQDGGPPVDLERRKRFGRSARLRIFAAAAVIAALAVGIWIGRAVLPGPGAERAGGGLTAFNPKPASSGTQAARGPTSQHPAEPAGLQPDYFVDARFTRERERLIQGLEARLAALPPGSREKVVHSLKAISDSKRELEAELGKDPSNALLQELLVNTYQDEMRVLTAVHEAANAAEGI